MMRSLYSGVSGLKNHQTRMDVVGNNISNVNTTGFKSSRVTFSDTLSQTLSGASAPTDNGGGTNPKQIGLGSATSSIDTLFTDGSVQSTGVNTDLCLSGNGLFVVKDGNNAYYTRNGNFKFDAEGNYVNSDGLMVQGWMGTDGVINSGGDTTGIKIPAGKTMAAKASGKMIISGNLNADAAVNDTSNIISTSYDSQGAAQQITLTLTKVAANEWSITVGTPAKGTIPNLKFDAGGGYASGGTGTVTLDPQAPSGAAAINLDINASGLSSLTQYSGSNTAYSTTDGYAAGTLKSVSIDSKGIITGTYTNGVNRQEAQVAVAQFNNAAGLTKTGNSLYSLSNNSGEANIKTAGDLGCTITPSALEMSNVDMASELTDMIVTQRGYQSNSKIITVSDELLETLINMKR